MKRILALLFIGLIINLSIGGEPSDKAGAKPEKMVMQVDKITVNTLEIYPPRLSVEATGTVNSGGWSHPALIAVKSNNDDGVLVFNFMASPPDGMATQALAPIKASITVDKPANFKEVQIVAKTNSKTAK